MIPWNSAFQAEHAGSDYAGRECIRRAAGCIRAGGVVIFPTEGLYGLSCDCRCESALCRVVALKRRAAAKGLIVVADCRERLEGWVDFADLCAEVRDLLESGWPPHTTYLLPARPAVPALLRGQHSTLAVRVTDFAPLRSLVQACDSPLVSTSANLSGEQCLAAPEELQRVFAAQVDYIAPLPCGGRCCSSTIIDGRSGRILRRGQR